MLNSGYYPDNWSIGRIVSIHKKGDINNPANYRGITISSALGKLFNSILNNRLCHFLETNILCEEQSGFRKKHRTSDHMFILKIIMAKNKNIDVTRNLYTLHSSMQAFDTVWHRGQLHKLLKCGLSNKCYTIIKSMYIKISLSVQNCNGQNSSPFCQSLTGIRQRANLSPTLFNIYVNDLPIIFDQSCNPPSIRNMTISSLMCADDPIVLSESGTELQVAMDKPRDYCNQWSLTVNTGKTKFLETKTDFSNRFLTYNEELIEQVSSFKYLGIEFSYDGSNEVIKSDLISAADTVG